MKLHVYGYINKIRSNRTLEVECRRNIEFMCLVNAITLDHGTIDGFVKENGKAFHNTLQQLTPIFKDWGLIAG